MPITIPKLPAVLVAILGFLATALAGLEPTLSSPWREIVAAVLAVLAVVGVTVTQRAVAAAVRGAHAQGLAARKSS